MSLSLRAIFISSILFLFPLSSQADLSIQFNSPGFGYNLYKHNYYPQKNYQRHNSRYNKHNNAYSVPRYKNLSDLHARYGNKHAYDRANNYRNKYQNNYSNSHRNNYQNNYSNSRRNNYQRYQGAYAQGFNDGRRSKRHNRNSSFGYKKGK